MATSDPWIICPACKGEGTCVNPNIDSHGLSAEDFHEDPGFAEDYRNGVYDIDCPPCQGSGKLRQSQLDELEEAAQERRLAAREDGQCDSGLGDYRYGY